MSGKIGATPARVQISKIEEQDKQQVAQDIDRAGNKDGFVDKQELDAFEPNKAIGSLEARAKAALGHDLEHGGDQSIKANFGDGLRRIGDWLTD